MKEKIEAMISLIKSGRYDNEEVHVEYDALLHEFILNYSPDLLPLMTELLKINKDFWYA